MVNKFLKRMYMFFIYLFLYAPIVILIIFSFNSSRSRGHWGGFSLKWYKDLFNDSQIMSSLYYTVTVAVIAAIMATIIGTAAAMGINRMKKRPKGFAMNLTYLPVLNADVVTGISLMILFIFLKVPLGLITLLLAHITINIPYVILSVLPKLKQLNNNLYEAALDLGATPSYAFRKVILPEIMPGIVTGALLAFTLSLDDFVISFFTTGSGVSNLSITIYTMARRGINPKINALSTLLFFTVLILLLGVNKRGNKSEERKRVYKKKSPVKKIGAVALAGLMIFSLAYHKKSNTVTLNVYNWGDYIDESVLEDFEEKYKNIEINYENYATNEDMYVKINSGRNAYDIAIPSDYMVSKMIRENKLNKIDLKNIPNYKLIEDKFKNLDYDPKNEYSVPYMWGTVGILYNKTIIKEKINSWDALWDKKYSKQILMLDSQRESIGVALQKLGYSLNTKDLKQLQEAKQELIKQKPLVLAYVGDEVKDKMIAGEAGMTVAWAGDAAYMKGQNPDLEYVIPKEGSNIFFDAMVIPKTSKHQKEAELFINFMCETQIAKKNTEYIGYSTPQKETKKTLSDEILKDGISYPSDEETRNCEVYKDLSDMVKVYDRIWTEVKAAR